MSKKISRFNENNKLIYTFCSPSILNKKHSCHINFPAMCKQPIDSQAVADIAEDAEITVSRVKELARDNGFILQ